MGKLLKGAVGVGLGAALFVAGNIAPDVINKSEKEPTLHIKSDAKAIAENCGATALTDVLAEGVDPKLTAGQIDITAQKHVNDRMKACFDQYVTNVVAGVLEATSSPQVDVQMNLVTATTNSENKG